MFVGNEKFIRVICVTQTYECTVHCTTVISLTLNSIELE